MSHELEKILKENKDDFEKLENGKLRCKSTGHEFVSSLEVLEAYMKSKSFKYALVGKQLKQFEPHIVQSPEYKYENLIIVISYISFKTIG